VDAGPLVDAVGVAEAEPPAGDGAAVLGEGEVAVPGALADGVEPSAGMGAGDAVASLAKAAGSTAETVLVPGSTMSRRSPLGSLADALPSTRTSTPSEGPNQAGSVPPRVAPWSPGSLVASSVSQFDQVPVFASRARASIFALTRADGSGQVRPSRLNCAVSRLPSRADVPSAATASAAARVVLLTGRGLPSSAALSGGPPVVPWTTTAPVTATAVSAAAPHQRRLISARTPFASVAPEAFTDVRPRDR